MNGTDLQRRLIIDATRAPLVPFRRGFAVDKSGPFYPVRSVNAAWRQGFIRRIPGGRNRFTARSEK